MTLSRILFIVALLPATPAMAEPLERYRELTQVVVQGCSRPRSASEITVCGRRAADRWRVPLIEYAVGDPRAETLSMERNRLASAPRLRCGIKAIIADCGPGVGVTMAATFGVSGSQTKFRTLAD